MSNATITLELTVDEINGVLTSLSNMPYGQVAGLIEKIRLQAVPQVKQTAASPEEQEVEVLQ